MGDSTYILFSTKEARGESMEQEKSAVHKHHQYRRGPLLEASVLPLWMCLSLEKDFRLMYTRDSHLRSGRGEERI